MTTCENLKAIITGGSKGIGFAVARELASHGAELSICARGQAGLEHAAKELAEGGASVHTSAVDVGDGDALKRWVSESGERMGGSEVWPKPRCVGTRPSSVRWSGPERCKVRGWKPELAARSLNRMTSLGMPESHRVD